MGAFGIAIFCQRQLSRPWHASWRGIAWPAENDFPPDRPALQLTLG